MDTPVTEPLAIALPPGIARVLASAPELARALLVGGAVRDAVLGIVPEDLDFEVPGTGYDALVAALARHGATDVVGRSFGVVRLALPGGEAADFSLPRRDSRTGAGHRGFRVEPDPNLSPREAAARRDFTINALAWDPAARTVIDHFGGLADLRAGVLRHTSEAFTEDPLRVLRGMQLAGRFGLVAAPETLALCRLIAPTHDELALDRVRDEWFKWAARSRAPAAGLRFLRDAGWLAHYPEIAALAGVEQDPHWHPEGDVWTHTLHALDALVALPRWREAGAHDRIVWTLAVLLHDAGKPACTRREARDGGERIVSPAHDALGGPLASAFLARIGAPAWAVERVVPLVTQHMAHLTCRGERAVRRLARRLAPETIGRLAVVIEADMGGRPPLPAGPSETLDALLATAERLRLADAAPRPLLLGRHLLERGWRPGPAVGHVLDEAFEAQLDGAFADLDGALRWLDARGGAPRG